jgi:repressor LexA
MGVAMSDLTDKIKALCDGKGVSVKRFEEDCGFSNGYISAIRRQNSIPSADRLNKIAQYFGVSRDYLLGKETQTESVGVMIPLLGRVAAGIPITAVENIIGQEEISRNMAITGEFFALKIKGDSMSHYIMDGDVVVVKQQNDAETGDIVIALINGHDGCCKKIRKLKTGIMLLSLNPSYEPMIFNHSEIDSTPVYILGKVVEIRRSI